MNRSKVILLLKSGKKQHTRLYHRLVLCFVVFTNFPALCNRFSRPVERSELLFYNLRGLAPRFRHSSTPLTRNMCRMSFSVNVSFLHGSLNTIRRIVVTLGTVNNHNRQLPVPVTVMYHYR